MKQSKLSTSEQKPATWRRETLFHNPELLCVRPPTASADVRDQEDFHLRHEAMVCHSSRLLCVQSRPLFWSNEFWSGARGRKSAYRVPYEAGDVPWFSGTRADLGPRPSPNGRSRRRSMSGSVSCDSPARPGELPGRIPGSITQRIRAGLLLGIVHDRRLMREAQGNLAIRWLAG